MTIKADDVINKLEELGYAIQDGDTVIIQYAADATTQYIKNFCNITEIPPELYYVAVDMTAGTLLRNKWSIGENVCEGVDFDSAGVKSISEGDVSVSFNSDSSTNAASRYADLLDRLCNRDDELVIFRRLRW